ncbi:MAG: type IX secretion system membrane protein PorP/SprF [Paludibacter sp.]|nr:type IX secretion system membrane protein PorP/SprF [Bacteroidales bacterium]MCM1069571.1 type IX secretion system membrane protein PorP/SprF [Prevotella sp.]MCM1354217.1 type IX secretion system membrane protein PorP/SprF [Bacteroides sp.]MCM1443044.1 type IX secretion system membrane protein PorP/SprF [Muribaculum sp.]MCM1482291.1 type IX secretion system membrane protein PorP/SprF [Paludibacter sp.]
MKRCIVLCWVLFLAIVCQAQFDPQMGQYMYMPTAFNPAAAGEDDLMKVSGLHRMQFTGFKNAPMTTYFSFQSPFVIGKTRHGAGIRFMNDRYGLFTNQTLHVQYAYRQKLGKGYLSAGVDLGFVSVGFKGDSVNLDDLKGSSYHQPNDEVIPAGEESGMSFDMALGIYYTADTWYTGVSYSHVTVPEVEWGDYTTIRLRGTMYLMGGYNWRLRDKRFVLKPSAMLMTDFVSWDLNLTALCEYKERYRWGVGYRIGSNVGILLGMDIITGLAIGYTYELPTNKLLLESYGSHEIYLAYGFDVLKPKRGNKYKSIRYL